MSISNMLENIGGIGGCCYANVNVFEIEKVFNKVSVQ